MSAELSLESPELNAALVKYAERLQRIFKKMGKLSNTGIHLDRQVYRVPLQIQQCDTERERQNHWRGPEKSNERFEPNPPPPPVPESQFLHDWLDKSPEPMLLLAPFGSGKTVLLETFALELAEQLRNYQLGTKRPLVPLPVRLREWKWFETKNNDPEVFLKYLCQSQVFNTSTSDVAGLLNFEQIKLLQQHQLLLPMFDGFDELPDAFTGGSGRDPRSESLEHIQSLFSGSRYVVSSRPGYGAEQKFTETQTHTLRELSTSEVQGFIRNTIESKKSKLPVDALKVYDQLEPAVENLLSPRWV